MVKNFVLLGRCGDWLFSIDMVAFVDNLFSRCMFNIHFFVTVIKLCFLIKRKGKERGQEKDKKTQSFLLLSQPVASKECPLSAGSWVQGNRL